MALVNRREPSSSGGEGAERRTGGGGAGRGGGGDDRRRRARVRRGPRRHPCAHREWVPPAARFCCFAARNRCRRAGAWAGACAKCSGRVCCRASHRTLPAGRVWCEVGGPGVGDWFDRVFGALGLLPAQGAARARLRRGRPRDGALQGPDEPGDDRFGPDLAGSRVAGSDPLCRIRLCSIRRECRECDRPRGGRAVETAGPGPRGGGGGGRGGRRPGGAAAAPGSANALPIRRLWLRCGRAHDGGSGIAHAKHGRFS
mmetsp:Transcript_8646/g.28287  ORF Transcript_8646/g.28287 Transcript_8646/m.28287 type:complete len:257 (+) Transcript_8646:1030-1800(+)